MPRNPAYRNACALLSPEQYAAVESEAAERGIEISTLLRAALATEVPNFPPHDVPRRGTYERNIMISGFGWVDARSHGDVYELLLKHLPNVGDKSPTLDLGGFMAQIINGNSGASGQVNFSVMTWVSGSFRRDHDLYINVPFTQRFAPDEFQRKVDAISAWMQHA